MVEFRHVSVLHRELVESLNIKPGQIVIDCTAGGGGHTDLMLNAVGPKGRVLAFDRDPNAIAALTHRFSQELQQGNLILIQAPFSGLASQVAERGLLGKVSAIAADIGVSSPQLDLAERGFSFAKDGPLDMRMDPTQGLSAADMVNTWNDSDLLRIFREYGEEPKAHFVVKAIVRRRESKAFSTTFDLADLVSSSLHYKERSRKHPATKIFQALRIAVNDELGELEALLASVPKVLAPEGRCAIITFHSLEDRLVKTQFKAFADGDSHQFDKRLPLTAEQLQKLENRQFKIIKPFPLVPSDQEMNDNPRSRSAKLRVIERIKEN